MRLPELCSWGSPRRPAYICGYWCSGPETLLQGDGLMCFLDLQGKPEEIREQYLSKIYCNPMQALFSFLWLHLKNFATATVKREPYSPQKGLGSARALREQAIDLAKKYDNVTFWFIDMSTKPITTNVPCV